MDGSSGWSGIVGGRRLLGGIVPYRSSWLGADLLAGATLAAVAIPEGLGYAKIAGMPPEAGLYTCLLPVLCFALFASTRRLVIGADSATAAISAAAVGLIAVGDPERFFALSCLLAIMSGLLLLLAGGLHLGFLSDFMSRSVLAGFLTGVGIQIAIGQLDGILGVDGSAETTYQNLVTTLANVPDTNLWDLGLSAAVIVTILGLGRVAPRLPGPLIAVVGSIALAGAIALESKHGVEMVGALPAGLPTLSVPTAPWIDIVALAPTAMVVLLVQIAQSVSTASAFAVQHDDRHDANRDLIGLGVANLSAGLGSSFVVNGSPTKTGISDNSGTRSQLAMVVLALLTIPVLLFFTGVFDYLPEATLAAVVFVIAVHLVKIDTMRMLYRLPERGEFWVATSTAVIVALVGVGAGTLWAVVASVVLHLTHTARPHNTVVTVEEVIGRVEVPALPGAETRPGLIIYRFAANLYFANAGRLVDDVRGLVEGAPSPVRLFVLDASEIHSVDWTSAEALLKAISIVHEAGAEFQIARLPAEARTTLQYHGISATLGPDGYIDTVRKALKKFKAAEKQARDDL